MVIGAIAIHLLLPPVNPVVRKGQFDHWEPLTHRRLQEWQHVGDYDSLADCEAARQALVARLPEGSAVHVQGVHGVCVEVRSAP